MFVRHMVQNSDLDVESIPCVPACIGYQQVILAQNIAAGGVAATVASKTESATRRQL